MFIKDKIFNYYNSPEIIKNINNNKNIIDFNNDKSNIFSLGLTFIINFK